MENQTTPEVTTPEVPETTATPEALTMEQVQKMIQSESDKIRTQYSKKLKEAEDAKTALEREKMSDDEKKAAEQADLAKRLEEKEQALLARELEIKTIDLLKANELSLDFKQFVVDVNEDKVVEKIQSLKQLWDAAIKTAVESKFKENGRTVSKPAGNGTISKEEFAKMPYNERIELFQTNPELYKELAKY